jgi:hypothetical protein
MGRWRAFPEPDPVYGELEHIELLNGYRLRLADPPIAGAAEACGDVDAIRALAERHRGHPEADHVLLAFANHDEVRREAAA